MLNSLRTSLGESVSVGLLGAGGLKAHSLRLRLRAAQVEVGGAARKVVLEHELVALGGLVRAATLGGDDGVDGLRLALVDLWGDVRQGVVHLVDGSVLVVVLDHCGGLDGAVVDVGGLHGLVGVVVGQGHGCVGDVEGGLGLLVDGKVGAGIGVQGAVGRPRHRLEAVAEGGRDGLAYRAAEGLGLLGLTEGRDEGLEGVEDALEGRGRFGRDDVLAGREDVLGAGRGRGRRGEGLAGAGAVQARRSHVRLRRVLALGATLEITGRTL